jgi:hypothetical protein
MELLKSKEPMRRALSGIVLALEIAAIMLMHAYKINHPAKTEFRPAEFAQQQIPHSFTSPHLAN